MTRNLSNKRLPYLAMGMLAFSLLAGCRGKAHGPTAGAATEPMATSTATQYTCAMHPQIVRDGPGKCPICGMDLVPKSPGSTASTNTTGSDLGHLTAAPNAAVVSAIATVRPTTGSASADTITLPGTVEYDPRRSRAVAARVGGRIERLLVRFNYQPVRRGQKLLELYSPELVTAEQELIFLLGNDAENVVLVNGARQKLRLLGLTESQLHALARTRRPEYRVAIFSPYDSYVVESLSAAPTPAPTPPVGMAAAASGSGTDMGSGTAAAGADQPTTAPAPQNAPLTLTDGAYVTTGQTLFQVINTDQVWGIFQPAPGQLPQLRPGQPLRVVAEGNPGHPLTARVALIEPQYRAGASTAAVRVYLPNPQGLLRRGTRLTAQLTTSSGPATGWWLPRAAVVDLGTRQVAFVRRGRSFVPIAVQVGQRSASQVQVLRGLTGTEEVATNGQYLIDSESFVQTRDHETAPISHE